MLGQDASDAAFFDLVHALIDSDQKEEKREQRSKERHAYQCVQLVAPYDGENLPTQAEFLHVHCHDLSARGFSFTVPRPPDYKYLVVALGTIPFTFIQAHVVNISSAQQGDRSEFRVGCEFLSKIGPREESGGE